MAERPAGDGAGAPAGRPPAVTTADGTAPAARRRAWAGLAALVVVLAVALAIGGGVGSGGHQTDAQRAAAIDAQVRCPSCEDLSVAQSSASAAVAVRQQVARMVAQGESTARIEDTLVAQYGSSILLRPSTSGLVSLVWFVPAVAGALAVAALGAVLWRRSRTLERLRREQ